MRRHQCSFTFMAFIFCGLLPACAVQQDAFRREAALDTPVEPSVASQDERGTVAPGAKHRPPQQPAQPESESPVDLTLTQPELTPKKPTLRGPRFNLSVENADVRTVLFAVSQKTGQNIVIDPEIDSRVTVNLKNVTLPQVLEQVLGPLGLDHAIENDFIRVRRMQMATRIFQLNYILSRREGAGRLEAVRGWDGTHADRQQGSKPPPRSANLVQSSEETDLWQEIETGLQRMVSGASGKTAAGAEITFDAYHSINRQSGVILVRDRPDVLLRVAEFLEAVEGSVQRQVFIQAKILEVSLNDQFKTGIDWQEVAALQGADAEPGGLKLGLGRTSLNAVIDTLSRQGEVQVLSSPKLATLNNQRAVMKAGREDVYFFADAQAADAERAFVAAPVAEGIVLDVVPQINANGTIMMSIHTHISEKAGERTSPDGTRSLPILEVRESNNVVLARNGQTVVIGGLMKSRRSQSARAAHRFSILERLFPGEGTERARSELVILLTPEIMVGAAIDDRLKKETDRLERFDLSGRFPMGTSKP